MTDIENTVRTRFAPSPTGYLHVGGARTALFAWLFARKHQGQFILRIEDTDRERSTEESIQAIYQGMEWLGLDYDEGPYLQTARFDRYRQVIAELIAAGDAYRCYCSKERLQQLREQQLAAKQKPRYDGHCRGKEARTDNSPYVIRFANPQQGEVVFDDLIRGSITVANSELDDLIIARSDGTPTYNLTVVVDDWDMKITDIIRGDDHINNTPRQINILKALGADIPRYGHVPMIFGPDGKRLSKRHGAVSVMEYKKQGFLPEALLNYLVRLGWSYQDQEIFTKDEMIQLFSVRSIQRSPAAFNPEKLLWLNQHYLKHNDASHTAHALAHQFTELGISYMGGPSLEAIITAQAERCKTLLELAEKSRYFFEDIQYDEKAARKHLTTDSKLALQQFIAALQAMPDWDKEQLHAAVKQTAEQLELKMGKVAQPIRVALTGNTISPPIDDTLFLLGKDKVIRRLAQAVDYIGSIGSSTDSASPI